MSAPSMLEEALLLAECGFAVFPVWPSIEERCTCRRGGACKSKPGKHPMCAEGQHSPNRWSSSKDPETIRKLWARRPDASIGVDCDASGVLVLDFDGKGGRTSLAELEKALGPLAPTLTSSTGREDGGEHRWFKLPEGVGVKNGAALGVDMKGAGGYAVAPPSVHKSGTQYAWKDLLEQADLPEPWAAWCREASAKKGKKKVLPGPERLAARLAEIRLIPPGDVAHDTLRDATYELAALERERQIGPEWADEITQVVTQEWAEPMPLGEIEALISSAREKAQASGQIIADVDQASRVVDQALDVLARDGRVYQRLGRLVRTRYDDTGAMTIEALPEAALVESLTVGTAWRKITAKGGLAPCLPLEWTVDMLVGRSEYPGIRRLTGIVDAPTIRPDGSVLSEPGYDVATGLLMDSRIDIDVPDTPTKEEAKAALTELAELFTETPFEGGRDTYRSAALAGLLTLVARPAIKGPVPIIGVDGPQAGPGKTFVAQTMAAVAYGRLLPCTTYTSDQDEQRKLLLGIALAGKRAVFFDNVSAREELGGAVLSAAVTSDTISNRTLGTMGVPDVPWGAVVIATGINLRVSREGARRVLYTRLSSPCANPADRKFKVPDRLERTLRDRPRLLGAALTVLRAGFAHADEVAKATQGLSPVGTFSGWARVVRSTLVWLGEADPWSDRAELAIADEDTAKVETFARELAAKGKPMTPTEIIALLPSDPLRSAALGLCPGFPTPSTLGGALKSYRGAVFGAFRIVHTEPQGKSTWAALPVTPSDVTVPRDPGRSSLS